MYSQGYQVERIAFDIGVTQRMVYHYLTAWSKNQSYYIKIAKDAGAPSTYDQASIVTDKDKKVFTARELVDYYNSHK